MEEKKAVCFTAYKRTDGFEVSLTFRGDSGTEVLESMEKALEAIKAKGGTPVSKNFTKGDTRASGGTCKVHSTEMKLNKNGKPYHTKGLYPNLVYCNGRGFSDEIEGQSSEEIGKQINEDY